MTPKQFDDRYQRGLALLNDPAYTIERFADYKLGFTVTNLSNKEIYFVVLGSRTCWKRARRLLHLQTAKGGATF